MSDIVNLDEALRKPQEPSLPPELLDNSIKPLARLTRGKDVSAKYSDLLSRNTREEKTRETQQVEIAEPEVQSLIKLH
jgi:hypothetical protein